MCFDSTSLYMFYFTTSTYSETCTELVRTVVWNWVTCVRTLREKTWDHLLHVFTYLLLRKVKKKRYHPGICKCSIAHIPQQRQSVYLSVHLSAASLRFSIYNLVKKESVDRKTFWCLLFLPGSQSAFQEALHFTQPWPQPPRKLPGISPPLLMSFFERKRRRKKKTRKEKINTSVPFLRNQTLEWCWENRRGGERGAIAWIHSKLGRLKSHDLPEDGDLTPPDTRWHFTGPQQKVMTCRVTSLRRDAEC